MTWMAIASQAMGAMSKSGGMMGGKGGGGDQQEKAIERKEAKFTTRQERNWKISKS